MIIIGSYISRYSLNQKQIAQRMQNIIGFNTAIRDKRYQMPAIFVNQCPDFHRPAAMDAIHRKIIEPDMIAVSRA
jgi:hypothetical protein